MKPGEDEAADRAEHRYRIQARFDALLVEACAPGYSGVKVTTNAPMFRVVPEEDREALREAHEARDESLLDAMLLGVWTCAGWPPDMIDGPEASTPRPPAD